MHFVTGKVRLMALVAAFVGVLLVLGSTFTLPSKHQAFATVPPENSVSCTDVFFGYPGKVFAGLPFMGNFDPTHKGAPPIGEDGLQLPLTAKSLTRTDVNGPQSDQSGIVYFGQDEASGSEPADPPAIYGALFDLLTLVLGYTADEAYAVLDVVPDHGPGWDGSAETFCVDESAQGKAGPEANVLSMKYGNPTNVRPTQKATIVKKAVFDYTASEDGGDVWAGGGDGSCFNGTDDDGDTVADGFDPDCVEPDVPNQEYTSCSFSGVFGWLKSEVSVVLRDSGKNSVNYGTSTLYFGVKNPESNWEDLDGDTKPDVAVDPELCDATGVTAFPGSTASYTRNITTDNPVLNPDVALDPDGDPGDPVPKPQPADGDTLADDWDGDGCTDWDELGAPAKAGEDPFNPNDCTWNPGGVYNVTATVQSASQTQCLAGEPAPDCEGQPDGTWVTTPGTYFHCITKIDKGAENPSGSGIFDLTGAAQCYQDSQALSDVSQLLSPTPDELVDRRGSRGADGISGAPPPPPYASNAPSLLAGAWNSNTGAVQINICFVDLGGVLMGPNIIADVSLGDKSLKGDVNIYAQQSIADCGDQEDPPEAPVHQGTAFLPDVPIVFSKQLDGFDHDDDNCSDAQELTVPQTNKCGDDPYNPNDGPKKNDVIGTYDVVTTLGRADWNKGAGEVVPGGYFDCKLGIDTQTPTGDPDVDDVSGRIFCYQDDDTSPVNSEDGTGDTGDGLRGSPPPYPLGEVPQKSTPETHVTMVGTVDRSTNRLETAFCFDDAEGDATLGNVIVSSSSDIHTGIGDVTIWAFQSVSDCANLTPSVTPPGFLLGEELPMESVRQDNDLSTDTDGDGCTDIQEMGDNQLAGGYRDPYNPFDFFDPNGDGAISGLDFFGVLGRFNAAGTVQVPLNPVDPGAPNYYTSFDRGAGPVAGSNVWNTKTPDGQISGLDFFAVLGSFNSQGCDSGSAGPGWYN